VPIVARLYWRRAGPAFGARPSCRGTCNGGVTRSLTWDRPAVGYPVGVKLTRDVALRSGGAWLRRQFSAVHGLPWKDRMFEAVQRHSKSIGFCGYVLLTIQWCMDDVLMLRFFGVMVATSMTVFCYFQPVPLMVPVRFNLLFIAINVCQIIRILAARRDLKLNEHEQALWDLGFSAFLTKVEMRELIRIGRRYDVEPGMVVAQSGMRIQRRILVLISGGMEETRNGKQLARYEPGDFFGEFQLLEKFRHTGGSHKVTTAFSCNSSVVEWDTDILREYLDVRPEVRQKLERLWAEGLNLKLDRRDANASERGYADILRGILSNGAVGESELEFLKHVRETHCISDDCHNEALQGLGFTEVEFGAMVARGRRPWFLRWFTMRQNTFPSSIAFTPETELPRYELGWPSSTRHVVDSGLHVSGRWETGWSDSPQLKRRPRPPSIYAPSTPQSANITTASAGWKRRSTI